MPLKILDCTIRDGGHLNGWNFSEELVKSVYKTALKSKVDYFEIGYRFSRSKKDTGIFARCDDEFLFSLLDYDDSCKLTLMIEADSADDKLFKECKPQLTPVKAVRIAAYPDFLSAALKQCCSLKDKGYEVFLNLMASSEYGANHMEVLEKWEFKNILESLVFSDSFGAFLPQDVKEFTQKFISLGFKNIGFHSHNNLQLAFANALAAIDSGCCIIDTSVFGMGRGAGNLPIEILLGHLSKTNKQYSPALYMQLAEKYFLDELKKTPWGYNIPNLISGLYNIHPYYVRELYENRIPLEQVLNKADEIKRKCPVSFEKSELDKL